MKANSEWYRWNDPVWNLVLYQGNNSQDLITNLFRLRRAWQECYTNFFILLTSKVCGFEIRIAESPRSAHASLPKSNFRWGCCTTVQPNKLRFYIIGHEIGLDICIYSCSWHPMWERVSWVLIQTKLQGSLLTFIVGFHLHLLVIPFIYQFYSRKVALVCSSFVND